MTSMFSGVKKYFTNTSYLMIEQIIRLIIMFSIGIYVARYLGPGNYGLLNYSISFVLIFGTISTLGLDPIVMRELARHDSKKDSLLGTSFGLKFSSAAVVLALLFISVNLVINDVFTRLLIFIIGFSLVFQSFNVIDIYFQSKVLSKNVVYVKSIVILISACIKVFLILLNSSLVFFALVFLVENILYAIGFLLIFRLNRLSLLKWKFSFDLAKELLKNSWPLIIADFFIVIYQRIDQIIIMELLTAEEVGIYVAAVSLIEICFFIPVTITNSLFPAVISSKELSEKVYYKRMQHFYDLMTWIAIVIAIPITLTSGLIIQFLYGSAYYGAGYVLSIRIWSLIFVSLGLARGKWILTENLQRYYFVFTSAGALSNVFINLILIPILGINGAAFTYLISGFITIIVVPFLIKDLRFSTIQIIKSFNFFRVTSELFKLIKVNLVEFRK